MIPVDYATNLDSKGVGLAVVAVLFKALAVQTRGLLLLCVLILFTGEITGAAPVPRRLIRRKIASVVVSAQARADRLRRQATLTPQERGYFELSHRSQLANAIQTR
jgi:hypothetical protein